MKLSKFVKRAKSESYCMVIHADDSGIWLGTRLALRFSSNWNRKR